MKRYYFTFGQGHINTKGEAMADYFVRVMAMSWAEARDLFVTCFANILMPRPTAWSMQYDDQEWKRIPLGTFPKGEYAYLGPIATPGNTVFNMRLHTRDQHGKVTNEYEVYTREDMIEQLATVQHWGWQSSCVFRLDGCIEICLVHPQLNSSMIGFFNPNQVNHIMKLQTTPQPHAAAY
jgi:hypothetical protein